MADTVHNTTVPLAKSTNNQVNAGLPIEFIRKWRISLKCTSVLEDDAQKDAAN